MDLRSIENGVALITAQSKFVLDSIKAYKTVIENLLSVKTGENITVSIEVSTDTKVSEVKTQNKDSMKISQKKETTVKNPTLNPRYTLDNFIEGENSDIAFRAAQVSLSQRVVKTLVAQESAAAIKAPVQTYI